MLMFYFSKCIKILKYKWKTKGLQFLKLDASVAPMAALTLSTSDARAKMQPIFVVNVKFVIGRKIFHREFSNHFYGIENKITLQGEIAISPDEFPMNSYHDAHIESLMDNMVDTMICTCPRIFNRECFML